MSGQELKKSVEAMQNLRNDLTSSKDKALAFLVEAVHRHPFRSSQSPTGRVHNLFTSFVLGYHGCDRETGERLLLNEPFQPCANTYDWLGSWIWDLFLGSQP